MKKVYILVAAVIITALCFCGCGNADAAGKDEKISIVTTIFPEYDWVVNILGENPAGAEVTMLLDNGVDLHSYQPTAEDIVKISTCDIFIYVGGESDEWVEDALNEAVNKDMIVINLLDELGEAVKEEEVVEGMQEEDEHDHDHGDEDGDEDHEHDEDHEDSGEEHEHDEDEEGHHHEEGEVEYDEHVWLSLRNAAVLTDVIGKAIIEKDPANGELYTNNMTSYINSLDALDVEYAEAVSSGDKDVVLFGDRFPFRYLTDDYGLNYYAAFVGCSAETEASFETITFLAQKVDECGLSVVLTIEKSDKRIAETIIENTSSADQTVMTLDSMQSVTSEDVKNGSSYLSIMDENLNVLKEVLK